VNVYRQVPESTDEFRNAVDMVKMRMGQDNGLNVKRFLFDFPEELAAARRRVDNDAFPFVIADEIGVGLYGAGDEFSNSNQ
jgi:hypothetical protein